MTKEHLKYLESLCDAATPGPWRGSEGSEPNCAAVDAPHGEPRLGYSSWAEMIVVNGADDEPKRALVIADDNAKFIAEARTAVPELIEEIHRLRAIIAEGRSYGRD